MSNKETNFICYELLPVSQTSIDLYTPAVNEWISNHKIGFRPNHGLLHAKECITWGQLLIPILQERGIHLKPNVLLFTLGRHDIGRKFDKNDPEHSIRAAASIYTNRESFMSQYNISQTEFEFILRLILHHSQKFDVTKNEPDEMLTLRLIDRLTMIGRYQETMWLKQGPVDFLLEVTPHDMANCPVISRAELERMVNIEINLHRKLIERRTRTSEDYTAIYLALAKERGLII